MKAHPAALLAAILAACGSHPNPTTQNDTPTHTITIDYGPTHGFLAYCHLHGDGSATITLEADRGSYNTPLLTHELLHAVTRSTDHATDPNCYLYVAPPPNPTQPCPEDATRLASASGHFTVSPHPSLLEHTHTAILTLNATRGYDILTLAPR